MGIVKDSSVSGFLPSMDTFAVHYPGYPSSMSRAIETLGGTEGILKAHSSQSNKLELHFRPEDPYSHPAFGELQPCNNLLLKISRKTSLNRQTAQVSNCSSKDQLEIPTNFKQNICSPESAENEQQVSQHENELVSTRRKVDACNFEEVQVEVSADIVARVLEAYHFAGMVDYQYILPVHADAAHRKKRSWMEVEPQLGKGDLMNLYHEDLLILLPPLFSPKDVPENVVLRPSVTLGSKKKQGRVVQQRWEMELETCFAIDFHIEEIPKKVNWADYIPQDSYHWKLQMAVSKLFDERPIWPKTALNERLLDQSLKAGDYVLRSLLFRTGYYFSNGPFQRFWIRKGYDPRRDPESRIYQRIDFRVPRSLQSYCEVNSTKGLKQKWKDMCEFRAFPYQCHTSLQFSELLDEYIQQEIRKPVKQTTCTCATGWFSHLVLARLRTRIAVRFLSVYPESGAEVVLKSKTAEFEKLKRMQFHKYDLRPEGGGHSHANRAEVSGDEDKEETDDGDDEKEEGIEFDDDEEEDFNEALMAGEDGEISLQPRTYLDEYNISRNYLQELFGAFPSNEASGSNVQDADSSDGEYEIYGQCSDENNSDGEDY